MLITSSVGCTANVENLKQEAAAFCGVYDPRNWKEFEDQAGAVDLEKELNKRIGQVIKSDEFKQIISELEQVEYARDLYVTAQTKISALIGEKWDCTYFQEFYAISFVSHSDSFGFDYEDGNVVIVAIDGAGNFTVNSMELMDNKPETLKQGIKTVAASQQPKVIIKTTESTPKEALDVAMNTLHSMGVENTTVITP
jgi:hypothetical protein